MPLSLSTPSARFPVHHFSASSSHVYPPSSWLDLDSVVFIYPLRHQLPPCISPLSPICNLPHSAIAVAHIHSPLPSLRLLTQERHYNPNLIIMISPPVFYPPPLPLDLAFVIWRLESNRYRFTFLRYALSLLISQSCISIRDCFLLSFLLSVKAAHKRRVFWICSLVGCIWTCRVVKLANVRMLNSPGLITSFDAMGVHIRFSFSRQHRRVSPSRTPNAQSNHRTDLLQF